MNKFLLFLATSSFSMQVLAGTVPNNNSGLTDVHCINSSVSVEPALDTNRTEGFTCGQNITVNHLAGEVAPVTKTVTYATVINIPGEPSKCWITSNLGSDHLADSVDDPSEESSGWYWQFNRKQGHKHDGISCIPNIWLNINEDSDWGQTEDPCSIELGTIWRMPTLTEWNHLDSAGGWTDWHDPWNSGLKLHAAGDIFFSGLHERGVRGFYWSTTQQSSYYGWHLIFNRSSYSCGMSSNAKYLGYSIRCLTDCGLSTPLPGIYTSAPTQIIWNWMAVPGATGYKWNTTNDYASATDMGTSTTKTETDIFCGITYTRYVWAYNTCGYSSPLVLIQGTSPCPVNCQPLTDSRDGKTYGTVLIGDQCWMAQNLNVGLRIDGSQDQANNGIVEKYCYENDPGNCNVYGGLYQWNEMMNYTSSSFSNPSERKGICPNGWHLPSDAEWIQLIDFLGGMNVAGGKMKETGTNHWYDPNAGATNSSGFTALPSGYSYINGSFYSLGYHAFFLSTSEYSTTQAWIRFLYYAWEDLGQSQENKIFGFSVRCLKDTCAAYSSVSISIGVTANPVCSGSGVIFTATPTYGGSAPVYQWKVNGSDVGTNCPTYSYTPVNGDVVTCELTSNAVCASGSPAPVMSNAITVIVNEVPPSTPSEGAHVPSEYQITWNWNTSDNAAGYKWNTINDYNTAEDLGNNLSKTEYGLDCGGNSYTRYAWAYNGCGVSAPVVMTQITNGCPANCQPLTDSRDGKTYHAVLIGDQCWMKENLNIGTKINVEAEQTNNTVIEKYCFDDLESNCDVYGGLYQWGEMVQYLNGASNIASWDPVPAGNVNGICPIGWHLPIDSEWETLMNYLGGSGIAGSKMKEAGISHWYSPNTGATNSSGFTGLPGGERYNGGYFSDLRYSARFWSGSASSQDNASLKYLGCNTESVYQWNEPKSGGLSVRCLKDCEPLSSPATGSNIPSPTQIIWNWIAVPGATGYKWNTTIDYANATDMGTNTTKTEKDLFCGFTYTRYVWAYSSCGVSEPVMLFQATDACPANCQPLTDSRDGKTYHTILIGDQCWMKENLNVGSRVDGAQEQTNDNILEKYCMGDLESICDVYGGLYQWGEIVQYLNGAGNYTSWDPVPTGSVTGICPSGWHLPNDSEWTTLEEFLGNPGTAGGKMKETGTDHWFSPNTDATNESGFTALGGGYRYSDGYFYNFNYEAVFWNSSQTESWQASARYLFNSSGSLFMWPQTKSSGFSVRCIHNCDPLPSPGTGLHVPSSRQIIWNWNTVTGAKGYKWNTTNDYATATDMGTATTKIETDLFCGLSYTRYVWAYNGCGNSPVTTLTQTTTGNIPGAAGAISGPAMVEQGQTGVNYSVAVISDATGYDWVLPPGATISSGENTQSITVSFASNASSGVMTVNGTNECGAGTTSPTLDITVNVPANLTVGSETVSGSKCYNAIGTITVAGADKTFTVVSGGSARMIAGHNILYLRGTTVQPGGYMRGRITGDGSYCISKAPEMVTVPLAAREINLPFQKESSFFRIFPNPTDGTFTLELTEDLPQSAMLKVEIYGMRGERMINKQLGAEKRHEFSLSDKPAGIYFIRVISGERSGTGKIIKQ